MSARDTLARALGYPYDMPAHSYLFRASGPQTLTAAESHRLAGRRPVIACGSNRTPLRLGQKYADWETPLEIPVIRAILHDHDVVYAALVSSYGTVPATLYPSPGTRVELAVTFLDEAECARMDRTEGLGHDYLHRRLPGACLEFLDGFDAQVEIAAEQPLYYAARSGVLDRGGRPVPLSELPARGRRWPGLTQVEVQRWLWPHLGIDGALPDIVVQNAGSPALRRAREALIPAIPIPATRHPRPLPPRSAIPPRHSI